MGQACELVLPRRSQAVVLPGHAAPGSLPPHGHIAAAFEPIQDGRIYIEKLNGPFLFGDKGTPAEYSAGLKLAIERGWFEIHDSGTFVKFTAAGADLFAR